MTGLRRGTHKKVKEEEGEIFGTRIQLRQVSQGVRDAYSVVHFVFGQIEERRKKISLVSRRVIESVPRFSEKEIILTKRNKLHSLEG